MEDVKKIRSIINNLASGFFWGCTPQGYDYWNEVKNNLEEMLKNYCPHCGKDIT